jgi:hypothetical protein
MGPLRKRNPGRRLRRCACAASGQTAPPPSSVMKSRRFIRPLLVESVIRLLLFMEGALLLKGESLRGLLTDDMGTLLATL